MTCLVWLHSCRQIFLHLQKPVRLFGLPSCSLHLLTMLIVTQWHCFKKWSLFKPSHCAMNATLTDCLRLSFKDLIQATVTRRERRELRNICKTLCPDCTERKHSGGEDGMRQKRVFVAVEARSLIQSASDEGTWRGGKPQRKKRLISISLLRSYWLLAPPCYLLSKNKIHVQWLRHRCLVPWGLFYEKWGGYIKRISYSSYVCRSYSVFGLTASGVHSPYCLMKTTGRRSSILTSRRRGNVIGQQQLLA